MRDESTCCTGDQRLAASGVALAAPANAGCQSGWTPWGGGETCDGPIAPDGNFQRCQSVGVLGFGGNLPCFIVNVNDLNGQPVGRPLKAN